MSARDAELQRIFADPVEFGARLEIRLRDRSITHFGSVLSEQQIAVLETLSSRQRVAVAKARQMGITTACRAWAVWKVFTTPGYHAGLLSNKERGAKEIGRIDMRMLEGLDRVFRDMMGGKPLIVSSNREEVVLRNGSRLLYFSGKSSNDRGYTLDMLHVTEYAHVDDGADILATLLQSVPSAGRVIVESTPSHFGDPLHKLAEHGQGAWSVLFFPWFSFPEYTLPEPASEEAQDLQFTDEENALSTQFDLTVGQILWRRFKVDELGGDVALFRREFPTSIEEAYALAEGSWLDEGTSAHIHTGAYVEKWEGPIGSGILVQTLRPYDPRHAYVIGYDPAGGVGQDYSVATVLDRHTLDVVQVVSSNRTSVEDFSDRVALASGDWGNAHICYELNNHGGRAGKVLDRQRAIATSWLTTQRSKIDVLELLRAKIHQDLLGAVPLATKAELRTMARQPRGQAPAALVGLHDDRVISLALALQQHTVLPAVQIPQTELQRHINGILKPKPRSSTPRHPIRSR